MVTSISLFCTTAILTNYIFVEPITNITDATIVDAVDEVFTELTDNGFKPRFIVTDNQATFPLKS